MRAVVDGRLRDASASDPLHLGLIQPTKRSQKTVQEAPHRLAKEPLASRRLRIEPTRRLRLPRAPVPHVHRRPRSRHTNGASCPPTGTPGGRPCHVGCAHTSGPPPRHSINSDVSTSTPQTRPTAGTPPHPPTCAPTPESPRPPAHADRRSSTAATPPYDAARTCPQRPPNTRTRTRTASGCARGLSPKSTRASVRTAQPLREAPGAQPCRLGGRTTVSRRSPRRLRSPRLPACARPACTAGVPRRPRTPGRR